MQIRETVKCLVYVWCCSRWFVYSVVRSFVRWFIIRSPVRHRYTLTLNANTHLHTRHTMDFSPVIFSCSRHTASAKSITKLLKIKQVFERWTYYDKWTSERPNDSNNPSGWICVDNGFSVLTTWVVAIIAKSTFLSPFYSLALDLPALLGSACFGFAWDH